MKPVAHLVLLGLASSATVGCEALSRDDRPSPSTGPVDSSPTPLVSAAPQTTGSASGQPPSPPPEPSPIATLKPLTSLLPGPFLASTADGQQFIVTLATKGNPRPYRRPLAFYRLAQALGYDQVARTELRRIPTGKVTQLLESHPAARQYLTARATVTNDGTIAALLVGRVDGVKARLVDDSRLARWAELAASPDPVPPADAPYVGDYVRLLVLDYLAANVQRPGLIIDERGGRLVAIDNRTAFPGYVSPEALDIPLDRLELVVRFPAKLKTALAALDRESVTRQLVRGRFEDRLLGPRQLTDFAERRATLLTLLESRLLQYGKQTVFSL
ncbi:MAG: hypothetical protein JRI68_00665 [Deltaproteobacteria bacterium]|nr:hypothetical protein [Deltaproteobacteria bacterium]